MWVWTPRSSGTAASSAASSRSTTACASPSARSRGSFTCRLSSGRPSICMTRTLCTSRTSGMLSTAAFARSRRSPSTARGSTWTSTSEPGSWRRMADSIASAVVCAWARPASALTATTRSTKSRPAAWRERRRRTSTSPNSCSATRTASSASASARSISTSVDWRASRAAAMSTITPTMSAAIASARGSPSATKTRPTRTASEPPRSEAKCSAFDASAAECRRRAARWLTTAREASTAITTPRTRNDHHVVVTSCGVSPVRRGAAPERRNAQTAMRNALSASAAGGPALPWAELCSLAPGRTAIRTAKSVSSAATKSVPECAASAMRPRDPVTRPVTSLTATRNTAATTLSSAVRIWAAASLALRSVVICSVPAAAIAWKGRAVGARFDRRPGRMSAVGGLRLRDPVLDRAEPLDLHAHDVAVLEELRRVHRHADAARRAGQDEVAGLERAGLGDEVHEVVDLEQQVVRPRVLAQLAVDPRAQAQVLGLGHLVGRRDPRAERAEGVGALRPRPLVLALLQVAPADVVGHGVAGDLAVRPHDDRELDLVVQAPHDLRAYDGPVRRRGRGGQLEEHDRELRHVAAGLLDVELVVPADAEDRARDVRGLERHAGERELGPGRRRAVAGAQAVEHRGAVAEGGHRPVAHLPAPRLVVVCGRERGELHGGGGRYPASRRSASWIAASRVAASSSTQRHATPASIAKRGSACDCTSSTSIATATTDSATAIGSSTTRARPCAVNATPAAMTVSAQRGSARRLASDARVRARASTTRRGPARTAVETGIACGAPPAVDRIATVPGGQSGSSLTPRARRPARRHRSRAAR